MSKEYVITKGIIISKDGDKTVGDVIELDAKRFNKLSGIIGLSEKKKVKDKKDKPEKLEDLTIAKLKEKAESENKVVEGTGENGRVVKQDYINALRQ